jgi:hypothetical protein
MQFMAFSDLHRSAEQTLNGAGKGLSGIAAIREQRSDCRQPLWLLLNRVQRALLAIRDIGRGDRYRMR